MIKVGQIKLSNAAFRSIAFASYTGPQISPISADVTIQYFAQLT